VKNFENRSICGEIMGKSKSKSDLFFVLTHGVYCNIGTSVDGRLPFWCACIANKPLSQSANVVDGGWTDLSHNALLPA